MHYCMTHRFTVLQEKEKSDRFLIDQHVSIVMFFCRHGTLIEDVFVTQLSSTAGISVSGIVWVTKKLLFN